MMKKKNRLDIARKIISDVNREMQKPRLTESVRNYGRSPASPVAASYAQKAVDYLHRL